MTDLDRLRKKYRITIRNWTVSPDNSETERLELSERFLREIQKKLDDDEQLEEVLQILVENPGNFFGEATTKTGKIRQVYSNVRDLVGTIKDMPIYPVSEAFEVWRGETPHEEAYVSPTDEERGREPVFPGALGCSRAKKFLYE